MGAWDHGGAFSVDANVRVEASDRAGLERRLRYCAPAASALERLRKIDAQHLVCESDKPGPSGSVTLIRLLAQCASPRSIARTCSIVGWR